MNEDERSSDADGGDDDSTVRSWLSRANSTVGRRAVIATAGAGLLGWWWSTQSDEPADGAADSSGANRRDGRKTRPTYFTDPERRAGRDNVERFDWARAEREETVGRAETILDHFSLDDLWSYVGSQHVPRAGTLADGAAGYYPWASAWGPVQRVPEVAYVAKPGTQWRLTNGEYTLPTNDFEAYRQSGLDDEGTFDPSLADDALLVNEEHPEMGAGWGVDDGLGWVDEDGDLGPAGTRWVPVAWAHHWTVVYGTRTMLDTLSRAYLFTEDRRFARAATVLLDRLADVYPEMRLQDTVYFDDGGYTRVNGLPNPSHGGTGRGKQVGSIWESYLVKTPLKAYDAVFPTLNADADADADTDTDAGGVPGDGEPPDARLVDFLDGKATEYGGLPAKDTPSAIRRNVESGFVREVLPAVRRAQIRGNFGSHQTTLALSAVVQDDPGGYTTDSLDFLFEDGSLERFDDGTAFGDWALTGGAVLTNLFDYVDRDGHAHEGSVHYNSIVAGALSSVAEVLDGYDGYSGVDLYENPKFKRMFETQHPLTFLDEFVPRYGDTAGAGAPGFDDMVDVDAFVAASDTYDTDDLLRWMYLRNGGTVDGLRGDVFDADPGSTVRDVSARLARRGPLELDSTQLAGFGFSALRAGDTADGTARGVWTYYGRNAFGPDEGYGTSHCHRDTLNLGLFGRGLNLAPDLGYPEETGDWPKRWNWTANTVSHNTVVVNERTQDRQWVGAPRHFDHTDRVQVFDVAAPDAYEEASRYRRTTAQVTVDDANSYVVDRFAVAGGDDHHFSFHGPSVPVDEYSYDLRDGVSEFVVREGAGSVQASKKRAFEGDWSTCIYDPSSEGQEWRGAYRDARGDVDVRVAIEADLTGTHDYWHNVQGVYLGRDGEGRHVVAGVGDQGSGRAPRIGVYLPERNRWVDADEMADRETGSWYELSVSTRGRRVTVSLRSPEGATHARGRFSLPGGTGGRVGFFGALGDGQTGRLYFDAFTLDGDGVEFLRPVFDEQVGVRTENLDLTAQGGGTYAGPDVPKPGFGEDTEYNRTVGNGFNYLYDVERDDDPPATFEAEWDADDHWDVRDDGADDVAVRLTMLTDCDDVALATGDPPRRWNNPEKLKYLVAHRAPDDGDSVFTSVVEPYEGDRFVDDVARVPVAGDDPTARAVRVELATGRTDYVAFAAGGRDGTQTAHRVGDAFTFDGAFAVYSTDETGSHEHAYLLGGTRLAADGDRLVDHRGRVEGVVTDFTRDVSLDNEVVVRVTDGELDAGTVEELVGSWLYAEATERRNGAYEIVDAERLSGSTARLDVGDQTTIKRFEDPENPAAGYEYVLREGGAFVVPLGTSWSA